MDLTDEERMKWIKLDAILSIQEETEDIFEPPKIPNNLFDLYMRTKFHGKFRQLLCWGQHINDETYSEEEIKKKKLQFVAGVFENGLPKKRVPIEIRQNWDYIRNGNDWREYDFLKKPKLPSRLLVEFNNFFFTKRVESFFDFAVNKYIQEEITESNKNWKKCNKEKLQSDIRNGIIPIPFEDDFIEKFGKYWDTFGYHVNT